MVNRQGRQPGIAKPCETLEADQVLGGGTTREDSAKEGDGYPVCCKRTRVPGGSSFSSPGKAGQALM